MTRVAVVTGGAAGMGRAICDHLARQGRAVAVLDRDGDAAAQAAKELQAAGAPAMAATVDVSGRAAVAAAYDAVRRELGPIHIVVTSAGVDRFESFVDITPESWSQMLDVNLTGTFHCLQLAVPDMLDAQWGRIVTISSSSAQSGARNMAHYVASKGGVIGLTKALALDLAPHGVTVNTIPPSFILTPMTERAAERGDLSNLDAIIARTPVRRAGTADDIAAACAFLCSDDAGYITGQQINVNGGWYL